MALVYIALGSNLGNRENNIKKAIIALDKIIGKLIKCSSFYETSPVGFCSNNYFINAAAIFETSLLPLELLEETEYVERILGRSEKSRNKQYSDRCIDIDILFYDNLIIQTEALTIPHPEIHNRLFVLEPLNEIAPAVLHPILQKTVKQLFEDLTS
jgi:2-amino-4-hydroxy-6-hydroxymethyldihydropteridine diphosphokinase